MRVLKLYLIKRPRRTGGREGRGGEFSGFFGIRNAELLLFIHIEEKVAKNVSVAGLGVGVVTDLDFEKIFPLRLTGCVYGQLEYGKRGKHEKCQNKCRNSS